LKVKEGRIIMSKIKSGLIQMSLKGSAEMPPEEIRDRMLEAHLPLIDQAGSAGVQILCFQEVFTQPYFCPSQDNRWYGAAEPIPDGHTTRLMQEYAINTTGSSLYRSMKKR
jgi:N-carbamoylputrescine amidase